MNEDILKGNWNKFAGKLREEFGELTEDDWMEAKGERQQIVGRLQERYGYDKARAERELDRVLSSVDRY